MSAERNSETSIRVGPDTPIQGGALGEYNQWAMYFNGELEKPVIFTDDQHATLCSEVMLSKGDVIVTIDNAGAAVSCPLQRK